jgi:phospholipid transport system substrate-binding protein
MKTFRIFLIYLFTTFFLINNIYSLDEPSTRSFVVDIGNQAIKILKIPVDDKEKRKRELQNLLQQKFDMKLIAKVILGKEVSKNMSKEKLNTFADILETHIVNVYSSQLGTYKGQKFSVKNTDIKKKDAFVYSTIESPEWPVTNIVWRVRERNNILKVIDMQVEGVSLLRTKKNDFAMILEKSGIDGLISILNEMNKMPDLKIPGE